MSNRVIGYIRVSTEEQKDHGISIDAQIEKIRAYCSINNLELSQIINDAGKSAKDLKREGVQEIIKMSKNKEMDHLIVVKIDRLTRSTKDLLYLIEDIFTENKVEFHSINEKIDTTTAQGKFFLTLIGAMATMERELIGERTSEALQYKKSSGFKLGQEPYGYKIINGQLVEIDQEIQIVKYISEMKDKNYSYQKIADILNSKGVNPKKSNKWFKSSVYSIYNTYRELCLTKIA